MACPFARSAGWCPRTAPGKRCFGLRLNRARSAGSSCAVRGADLQTEHVRPVVVARRIETLALLDEPARLELCVENRLVVVRRPCEIAPVGSEDRAPSPADHVGAVEQPPEREIL